MHWDAWVALVGWCVFAPLYLRAVYREMKSQATGSPPLRARDDREDESLTKP